MIRSLLAGLLLLASTATAQDLPALYEVKGVAANDVLNIRTEPNAQSAIVAALTPDARNIEIVAAQNGWGLLNFGERSGWASLRYLALQEPQPSRDYPAICFGTEPFWSLKNGAEMVFEFAGTAPLSFTPLARGGSGNILGKSFALGANGPEQITAVITQESCNDGMSDNSFGLSVDLVVQSAQSTSLFSGCCALTSPRASSR